MALAPMMFTNLRARIDGEISVTDEEVQLQRWNSRGLPVQGCVIPPCAPSVARDWQFGDELMGFPAWRLSMCKLFSRTKGRPITLRSGRQIQGPHPVRDARHMMGFPWLKSEMKARVKRSNQMVLKALMQPKVADLKPEQVQCSGLLSGQAALEIAAHLDDASVDVNSAMLVPKRPLYFVAHNAEALRLARGHVLRINCVS